MRSLFTIAFLFALAGPAPAAEVDWGTMTTKGCACDVTGTCTCQGQCDCLACKLFAASQIASTALLGPQTLQQSSAADAAILERLGALDAKVDKLLAAHGLQASAPATLAVQAPMFVPADQMQTMLSQGWTVVGDGGCANGSCGSSARRGIFGRRR